MDENLAAEVAEAIEEEAGKQGRFRRNLAFISATSAANPFGEPTEFLVIGGCQSLSACFIACLSVTRSFGNRILVGLSKRVGILRKAFFAWIDPHFELGHDATDISQNGIVVSNDDGLRGR